VYDRCRNTTKLKNIIQILLSKTNEVILSDNSPVDYKEYIYGIVQRFLIVILDAVETRVRRVQHVLDPDPIY
jgi:hypothetical protein